jgi:hypothetical protein
LGNGKGYPVPFKEQARPMEKESVTWFTCIWMRKQIDWLLRVKPINFSKNEELTVEKGEEVDLTVSHITEIGINVILMNVTRDYCIKKSTTMLYVLDRMRGYIKKHST